jgi:NAD(P)-dependent dehydrogenase (short-subunit alcohol dehydrogenase family)
MTLSSAPVAVIAGAGGGGIATASSLARAGYRLVVIDSRKEAADAAVAALGDVDARATAVDLLDADAVVALRDRLIAELGRVDAVVHLVGGWRGGKTLALSSVEDWAALHPPIVGTLATLTAVFGADVKASDVGRVVMVTSTAAATPTAGNIAYAAAKSAAEAWMAGVADFLRDTSAASVVVAVKALLTDAMAAAGPERDWTGFTHVRDLGDAIADVCSGPAVNGARVDLTRPPYSAS